MTGQTNKQDGRWTTFLLLFALILPACGGGEEEEDAIDRLDDCPAGPLFTVPPIALEDVVNFGTIGNINPPGHVIPSDHGGFYLRHTVLGDGTLGSPVLTDVMAPSNITIIMVAKGEEYDATGALINEDFAMEYSPCKQFKVKLGHVSTISEKLEKALTDWDKCESYMIGSRNYHYCSQDVDFKVSAGDIIGTIGGPGGPLGMDFGGFDARINPLAFANPKRYFTNRHMLDSLHVVCPLDYYEEETKAKLYQTVGWTPFPGDPNGFLARTVEPICGEYMQDKPGTLQGNWFLTTDALESDFDYHLAMVHWQPDPTQAILVIGLQPAGGFYYQFQPEQSGLVNRDFPDIRADGNIYCYGNSPRVLAQLLNDKEVRVEQQEDFCIQGGDYLFTDNAVTYQR